MLKSKLFKIALSNRTRRSPFFDATVADGLEGISIYNHMVMPIWYNSSLVDYWNIVKNVTMWDVAFERQVEITGPDAFKLVTLLSPRNISKMQVGQCKYVPILDEDGGILNDPVLLRLGDNHFWLSIADSDLLLWAKGVAYGQGFDVDIIEPDVSPLAIQGPNWLPVAENLFGDWIKDLKFFHFREINLGDIPLVVARSGWSKQGGLELYLRDGSKGSELWDRVKQAGKEYDIKPATPSTIERIEGGLLSYGNDMTSEDTPYHVGLGKYCHPNQKADFIGKAALQRIQTEGVDRHLTGVVLHEEEWLYTEGWWPLYRDGIRVGDVRSAVHSPRLERNIGLAMIENDSAEPNTTLSAKTPLGFVDCTVTSIPFIEGKHQHD